MAKRGRKKKPGARHKCGKRKVSAIQDDMRSVVVEARMRIYGVGLELAKRDTLGSPLGRLLHWHIITPAQAGAGYDFASTLRGYLAASNGQRPSQGKAGFVPTVGGTAGDRDMSAHIQERARAYMEALREVDTLDPTSPSATSIVWDVCISENDRMRDKELGLLRAGLNALSRVHHRGVIHHRRPAA